MVNKYFIGLDGGGTKTKCVVTDDKLNPLYECEGGPSNFLIIGTEKVSATILGLIKECQKQLNFSVSEVQSILIGTTGAGRRKDAEQLANDFILYSEKNGYKFNSFRVESDARIALEGAFSGNPGSILIAGTGSIMFGKDKNANLFRVGGFGRYIGDEGSGNSIGKKGLNFVAKEYDGRGEKTILTELIRRKFNITDPSKLIIEVYSNNLDLASIAPLVIEAAEKGDQICNEILESEIDGLILHVKSMLNFIGEPTLRLCLIGGIISTNNYYANKFKLKLQNQFSSVKIEEPELPPAMGAAFMAKAFLSGIKNS